MNLHRFLVELDTKLDAKLETIFLEEKKRPRSSHPLLAGIGAIAGVNIAHTGLGVGTIAAVSNFKKTSNDAMINKSDAPIIKSLGEEAKRAGYRIDTIDNPLVPGGMHPKHKMIYQGTRVRPYFAPGVLAHEVGHAKDPFINSKIGLPLYNISKIIPGVSSLVTGLTENEKTAKVSAGVGAVGAAPMLGAEIRASISGIRALRKGGIKGLRSLTPAIGLPTYAGIAAAPSAIYGIKKKLGGYRES